MDLDQSPALAALWEFTSHLADLIAQEHNSIWAFVVRNAYKPAMLRESFDVIVGNPPWLSYRYIADPEYQAEVKRRAVDDYQIAPRLQKLMTQMELATVFLVHTLDVFGRVGARLAFVMPRSVLTADQHANLRTRNYIAKVALEQYWDLRDVSPLLNVPSCVLFAARKAPGQASNTYTLPAVECQGRLPRRDPDTADAVRLLRRRTATARLIYMGERTALSTAAGRTQPTYGSAYRGRFRQGAIIVPRNCYFVAVDGADEPPRDNKLYRIATEPEQAKLAKKPWNGITLEGDVEGRYLFRAVMAKHLLPFHLLEPDHVVLPMARNGTGPIMLGVDALRRRGDRRMAAWLQAVEKHWGKHRGKKTGLSAVERLDFQHGLTNQRADSGALVLYNASGMHVAACAVEAGAFGGRLVVDHKLYWAECASLDEALYVAAVLNSEAVNDAIKPFQSLGLLGERDIHKKVLDVPIPNFSAAKRLHRDVAAYFGDADPAIRSKAIT